MGVLAKENTAIKGPFPSDHFRVKVLFRSYPPGTLKSRYKRFLKKTCENYFFFIFSTSLCATASYAVGETEESLIEPVTLSSTTKTSTTSSTTPASTSSSTSVESVSLKAESWTRGIGSHFAQMADAFAQSISEYRVRYATATALCPKLGEDQVCARQSMNSECWSVGVRDGCEDNAVCCFNGCENVCYNPNKRQPMKKLTQPHSMSFSFDGKIHLYKKY